MSQREENGRAIPQRPSFEGMVAITLLLAILFALAMLSFGTTSQEILQETCRGVSTDSVAMARFLRVIFQAPVLPIGLAFFISIQMCLNRSTLAFGMKVFTWVLIGVALGGRPVVVRRNAGPRRVRRSHSGFHQDVHL